MRYAPRVLGAATAAYSVAIMVRPAVLAKPCGLSDGPTGDQVSPAVGLLVRSIGARDAALGLAMVLAPRGRALQTAVAARVAADLADAVVFGTQLPDTDRRLRIAGVAAGWAALCAVSGRWAS